MNPGALLLSATLTLGGFGSFGGTGSAGRPPVPLKPTVAWYGDSLTQGACSPTPPPQALDGLLEDAGKAGYIVANKGVSGETAHEIHERVRSGAATACRGSPCGHYVVQGMVNTLKAATFAESTPAAVAAVALNGSSAEESGTCDTETANDCGLLDSVDYLHDTYPRARLFAIGASPYAGCDNDTCPSLVEPGLRAAAANAGLLSACAARPWLTCLIPYDDFEDPENADNLKPSPDGCEDGIHYKDPLSELMAQKVYDAATW